MKTPLPVRSPCRPPRTGCRLALGASILASAFMLASAPAPLLAQTRASAAPVVPETITYYLWDDPTYRMIVDAFNASQREVRVDARYLPAAEYESKMATLLAGGVEVDAYMQKDMSRVFPDLEKGFIEELDEWFARSGAERASVDAYRDTAVVDGRIVGIPFRGAGSWIYFNRKLFERANLETPDVYAAKGIWTWDAFRDLAARVSSRSEGIYGALIYTWGSQQVIPSHQRGMPFIDAEGRVALDETILRFFRLRRSMETAGSLWPLLDLKLGKLHYSKAFMEGRAAMILVGDQFPGQLAKGRKDGLFRGFTWRDWGITRIPCDEESYRSFGNPTMNHVNSASRHKKAAFRFISWMGGPEGAKIVAEAGFLPAVMSPEIRAIAGKNIPDSASLDFFIEPKRVMPQFYTVFGAQLDAMVSRLMEDYLAGRITDPELLPRMTKELKVIAAARR